MLTIKTKTLKSVLLLCLFFMTGTTALWGQKHSLEGKVQDSLGRGISNTNLIATPVDSDEGITFSIANQEGRYKLSLAAGVVYKIDITSLGFASMTDSLKISEDTIKNYTLTESTEELEQVIVKAQMAVVVNEDTITYRVDKFRTGDERKLREILKKLPGVEVDREGNVTVNGKQVSKLMVDGQDFFGGDVRLGVNYIPADAVEEVEAIDNYNEVSFMKGLSDSDQLAMNIKLKKDRKDFIFGESEAGGGIKDRYFIHPALFYYSPNTTVNLIGSFNNANKSPLDFRDVMRFRGGFAAFDDPVNSGDGGLTQFSGNEDILSKKTNFGAVNFTQRVTPKLRLEAYSIVAHQKSRSLIVNDIEYLTQNNLLENRTNESQRKNFSSFNKVRLRYTPKASVDIAYDLIANFTNNHADQLVQSQFTDSLSQTHTLSDPRNIEVSQYFRYNTQPTYEHTSEIKGNYIFKTNRSLTGWDFDRPVFSYLIPIAEDGGRYHILHDYLSDTHTGRVNFKHYWVLDNVNHIYPVAGLYFFNQSYESTDFQRLRNGQELSFFDQGFDNDLSYNLLDSYLGFQYKFKVGEVIFRPGLVYHHYFWKAKQFKESITDKNKGVALPELKVEYQISSVKKLELEYNLKSSFAEASSFANRLRLTSFNSLFRGNEDLENSLFHEASINYYNRNILFNGTMYHGNFRYTRREKSIRQSTILEGIDQIGTSIYSAFPENSYTLSGGVDKRWRGYSAGISLMGSLSDYTRLINEEELKYTSQYIHSRLYLRTRFKKWPNFEAGLTQRFSTSKSGSFKNNFWSAAPSVRMDYAFGNGFIFKANYDYTYTKDNSPSGGQSFQTGNTSLFYRAEDSPWGFEVRVDNLFDLQYKRNYAFDQFMIYDQRIYLQPRTVLLILSYQI